MTSWGVEGGEVPRWLFALQSWEFPPPPPPCSLLTFGPLWPGGETETQGRDLSGYKARWPAPLLGSSTGGCPTPQFSLLPSPQSWAGAWKEEEAVHFDPGSLPARLLTDCHLSVPCRRRALHHPPPHCRLASCLPQCQVEEGSGTASPFQVAVGRVFCFCFCCHLCKY